MPKVPGKSWKSMGRAWSTTEQKKVDGGVVALLRRRKQLSLLVLFQEQADTQAAYEAAVKAALAGDAALSSHAIRVAGRSGVVQALQTVAAKAQSSVGPLVKRLGRRGQCRKVRYFYGINAMSLKATEKGLRTLARRPEVARILPDQWVSLEPLHGGPPDEVSEAPQWNLSRIGAPEVWARGFDGTGVTVGAIDTGAEYGHPALQRKFRGYDPAAPSAPNVTGNWYDAVTRRGGLPYDDNQHGTHVTGIMVGGEPGDAYPIGVAPGARWIAAKGFNAKGQGRSSWLLAAGEWMLAPRDQVGQAHPEWAPDVLNCSWSGGRGIDEWYRSLITNWRTAGIVPVVAAGNLGPGAGSVTTPGNYPESIAVGALDSENRLADFSGRGPSPYGEIKPEIAAPGVSIRSSVPRKRYARLSGTSMATPHIGGVAALMLSAQPTLSVDQLEAALLRTAVRLTSTEYPQSPNNGFGCGLVSAPNAVAAVTLSTISGRVLGVGLDLQPPLISHSPVTSAYALVDLPLEAFVSDDLGVGRVEVLMRPPGQNQDASFPMERVSGESLGGRYRGIIRWESVLPPSFDYRIRAVDSAGLESLNGPHTVQVRQGIGPGYRQDFEQVPDGFLTGGSVPSWEWGEPVFPQPRSGRRLFGFGLDGEGRPMQGDGWLQLPPVDLRGFSQGRLHLWQWLDLGGGPDCAEVRLSADGGTHWHSLHRQSGSGRGWEELQLDLSPFAGKSLLVRLCLSSDGAIRPRRWLIDDLMLLGPGGTVPGAPVGLTAESTAVGSVRLRWSAPGEADIALYQIQRAHGTEAAYATVGETEGLTFLDSGAPAGQPCTYRVVAADFWGGVSLPSATATAVPVPVKQIFRDDFEGWSSTWTAEGALWEHGIPTGGPGRAFSGERLWAARLGDSQAGGVTGSVISPPVSLGGLSTAALQFAHWFRAGTEQDFGAVEVSRDDGLHWSLLAHYTGECSAWRQPVLDLTPCVGRSVRIRFRFTAGPGSRDAGWYLDDLRVVGQVAAAGEGQVTERVPAGLPLAATVRIVESGRSVLTDPPTGSYALIHTPGEWTVRAEAAGFTPAEQRVALRSGQAVQADFALRTQGQCRLQGSVRHSGTGEPVAGVLVTVAEDSALPGVFTGTDGLFRMELPVGTYTLRLERPFFYPLERSVMLRSPGERLQVEAVIRPFATGREELLAYDDGGYENADAWSGDGSGWAVRISPPADGVLLARAEFLLMDTRWPVPGGTEFNVALYDSDGPGGAPGRLLVRPRQAAGLRDGSWTQVDLSELGLVLVRDFYLAYVQKGNHPDVPALTTDISGPFQGRTWERDEGGWLPAPARGGNRMIRAVIRLPGADF